MGVMNEAQQQLARRLVEHPAWRWMPGMLCTEGYRWGWSHTDREVAATVDDGEGGAMLRYAYCDAGLPELTDPATVGCLLALAREVWGDPGLYVETAWHDGVHFIVRRGDPREMDVGWNEIDEGEGHALARAILAAPTKETA